MLIELFRKFAQFVLHIFLNSADHHFPEFLSIELFSQAFMTDFPRHAKILDLLQIFYKTQ
jgi:hypothetical protein